MQQATNILDFSSLSRDAVAALLQQYQLSLTVDEALTIQHTLLKRPPTLVECVLWSIQGSEHCSYKSSRQYLQQLLTDGPQVILGAKEDAGIVAVATDKAGHRYGVVMSHESHNHPSQIVPYEGAATGVGGNVRDVSCMGARVIALADSLRFGDISRPKTHFISSGVVAGIAGYGNPLGVPNLAGDVYYDAAYNENCLVTVVTLGIVREDEIIHSYAPKDAAHHVFILVGKPTDNSGFGGASFASTALTAQDQEKNKGAVQEPNAFLQRHLLKANEALFALLREKNLLHQVGFKDLGAGGIACASVELAEAGGYGADIDLASVPTNMPDLNPAALLCSETQERFMWVVPADFAPLILTHYNDTFALPQIADGACAAVIGKIRCDGQYVVHYHGNELVNAKAHEVTKGIVYNRAVSTETVMHNEPTLAAPTDFAAILLRLLAHENIASRAPIIESYDKQVQGRTHIEAGSADAGVMQPFNDDSYPEEIRGVGIALSLDQNPRYNQVDAYWGAVNAVVEAVRNVVAVGATPVAVTDCLCFGNPEKPEQMQAFVAAVRGIADACRAIPMKEYPEATLPVIAGNVSFYNESAEGAIPPSPMISCLGVIADINKAITYDLKRAETALVLVGERHDECGGSVYYQLHHELGANIPQPDLATLGREMTAVQRAIASGLILSAHDISEGGVAVALAEMSFKREIGVCVEIPGEIALQKKLFGETGGFILEVAREKLKPLRALFAEYQLTCHSIGLTNASARLQINGVIDIAVSDAKTAWEYGLREKLQ